MIEKNHWSYPFRAAAAHALGFEKASSVWVTDISTLPQEAGASASVEIQGFFKRPAKNGRDATIAFTIQVPQYALPDFESEST